MIPYLLLADVQNTALAAILVFSDRVPKRAAAARSPTRRPPACSCGCMSLAYLIPAAVLAARLLTPRSDTARSSVHAPRSPVAVTGRTS
jgi:hypothetical protein